MCCALRQFPVTDFMSDHPFGGMNDRGPPSPPRREELFARTTLPRERTKEDIETAQHLLGHSQAARNNNQIRDERKVTESPSPTYELQSHSLTVSPTTEQVRQSTPRSTSLERRQSEISQSYSPITSQSETAPTGQVCR